MSAAVVLLSGGLDSVTTLFVAKSEGHDLFCISFDYGQRNQFELTCAKYQSKNAGVIEHHLVQIDPVLFHNSSALIAGGADIPENRPQLLAGELEAEVPITYVPARNLLFLSYALSFAESRSANHIYIGANALDYSGYPDCRPAFLKSFEQTANLGTKAGAYSNDQFQIHAPLIDLSKADIVRRGLSLGVNYGFTSSCYQPTSDGKPCGCCDSCLLRAKGFGEAGETDSILSF